MASFIVRLGLMVAHGGRLIGAGGRRRQLILLGLAVAALLMQVLLEYARVPVRQRDYDLKMAASQLASAFTAVVLDAATRAGSTSSTTRRVPA